MTNRNQSFSNNGNNELFQTAIARVHQSQAEKMARAMKVTGIGNGADYLRLAIARSVAQDLNETIETLPAVVRGRHGSQINQAAKKVGMSPKDFLDAAGKIVAAQALGYTPQVPDAMLEFMTAPSANHRAAHQSGTHKLDLPKGVIRSTRKTG